jgi:hypothetical protein
MLESLIDAATTWPAMVFSTIFGMVIEKFFNITGRFLIPLWNLTLGKALHRRRMRIEHAVMGAGETYAVGAAKHEIYVRQFAIKGFKPDHITTQNDFPKAASELLARLPETMWPQNIESIESEIARKTAELDAADEAWNAEKLALRSIKVSRLGSIEEPTLRLGFAKTDYATFQVIANHWERTFKTRYSTADPISAADLRDVLPGLSNSFGVNLTVETADGDIILTKRSGKTQSAKNLRHISVNEGMAIIDVDQRTGVPDPYLTALRGIEEELGITLPDEPGTRERIIFHSLVCDVTRYEWALLGHVNLTGTPWTNAEFINARRFGMSPDDWESDSISFLPVAPKAIEEALRDDSDWVGHGYMNLVLSALYRLAAQPNAILKTARSAIMSSSRPVPEQNRNTDN